MKPLLSVCMIVKDEEKVLSRCLESIHGVADEIISKYRKESYSFFGNVVHGRLTW